MAEDVNFEPEEELGDIGAAKAKLKKLRDEFEHCKKEKAEYLDGWQRCKADSINARKDAERDARRAAEREIERIADDIIHALDSFDMARESPAWEEVDAAWRSGMENVHAQLLLALGKRSIEPYGLIGDTFDPRIHEAIKEIKSNEPPGSVLFVMRRGYRTQERVLRPAHVAVSASKESLEK